MTTTMREVLGSVFSAGTDDAPTPYQVEFRIDVLDSWKLSELAPVIPSTITRNCAVDALSAS
jgi:hypothetical protein